MDEINIKLYFFQSLWLHETHQIALHRVPIALLLLKVSRPQRARPKVTRRMRGRWRPGKRITPFWNWRVDINLVVIEFRNACDGMRLVDEIQSKISVEKILRFPNCKPQMDRASRLLHLGPL